MKVFKIYNINIDKMIQQYIALSLIHNDIESGSGILPTVRGVA